MCAAVRASLETHIRAEEAELWPLFTEHFTTEEQQYLVRCDGSSSSNDQWVSQLSLWTQMCGSARVQGLVRLGLRV